MERLVIDTDPGVDDAHAIMMAAAYPGVSIEAVTSVMGNVGLGRTTANALKILDAVEVDAPVYAGAPKALVRSMPNAANVHGEDGLGDSGIPASSRSVEDEHAVEALIRLANESPGELTLIALGPLTNVALATRLDPELPEKYKRFVSMGGAVRALGNTANPTAEFNVYSDPDAARIVYETWPGLELVPWETVVAHPFAPSELDELLAIDTPKAEFFRKITQKTLKFIEEALGGRQLFAADGLAMAAALEPKIVTHAEDKTVQVELDGGVTRGQTVVDWYDRSQDPRNVRIVHEVDRNRFWEMFKASIS